MTNAELRRCSLSLVVIGITQFDWCSPRSDHVFKLHTIGPLVESLNCIVSFVVEMPLNKVTQARKKSTIYITSSSTLHGGWYLYPDTSNLTLMVKTNLYLISSSPGLGSILKFSKMSSSTSPTKESKSILFIALLNFIISLLGMTSL